MAVAAVPSGLLDVVVGRICHVAKLTAHVCAPRWSPQLPEERRMTFLGGEGGVALDHERDSGREM